MKNVLRWIAIPFAYILGAIIANIFLTCLFRYTLLWGIFLEVKHDFTISGNILRQVLGYFVLIVWSAITSFGSIYCAMCTAPKYKKQTGLVIATTITTASVIAIFLGIKLEHITMIHITSSIIAIITSFITVSTFD